MQVTGFAPNTVQQGDETGVVNVLNGNLTLSFPIGPTYPVNEGLSYGLTLTYSSHLRTWVGGGSLPYYIRGRNTAGWGGVLHFGRIASDPQADGVAGYQSPDGTWHPLHPASGSADCGTFGTCFLTKDNTHIRAVQTVNGWRLWTPDGVERELYKRFNPGWACGSEDAQVCSKRDDFEGWYTTRILDPLGTSSVTVEYDVAPRENCILRVWDSVRGSAAPTLTFQNSSLVEGVTIPGGMTTGVTVLVGDNNHSYTFDYDVVSPVGPACPSQFTASGRQVALLRYINAPESLQTAITYDGASRVPTFVDLPGDLAKAEYVWECIEYQQVGERPCPTCPLVYDPAYVHGVAEKRVRTGSATQCSDSGVDCWTYDRPFQLCDVPEYNPCGCPCGFTCSSSQSPQTNPNKVPSPSRRPSKGRSVTRRCTTSTPAARSTRRTIPTPSCAASTTSTARGEVSSSSAAASWTTSGTPPRSGRRSTRTPARGTRRRCPSGKRA
jgi:hypothetical protein